MTTGPFSAVFGATRREDRAALIPFLATGDPDPDATVDLALAAADAGADILELGVPYSDPLADGPVIQAAYTRALRRGITLDAVFRVVERIAGATTVPLVLMTSVSAVVARGVERFCDDAAAAGAGGILVPDLLPEDAGTLRAAAAATSLATIFLTVPWATAERTRAATAASTGFVYLVSRRGVTGAGGIGAGSDGAAALAADVARVRAHTELPIAVGFGVAGPADAARVAASADGVIVGSALVSAIHEAGVAGADPVAVVRDRVGALRSAMPRGSFAAATGSRESKESKESRESKEERVER